MGKPQESEIDPDKEYERIFNNETIYLDTVSLWKTLRKVVSGYLPLTALAVIIIVALFFLPPNTQLNLETLSVYSLQVSLVFVCFGVIFVCMISTPLLIRKVSRIEDELGLQREELIYLRAYETYSGIDSYLNESNAKRKLYFRQSALKNAQELTENVQGWRYGNIRLVSKLIGDQIDLLKDNVRRLVLSNVAKGDDTALRKVSEILVKLCKYIYSPSIEKLGELNDAIKEIPFKEYKYLTRKERMGRYFYGRPRVFRLVFAFGITITVMAVLVCLGQNLGLSIAVGVTCFWGAFAGFDKIFRVRET